LMSEVVLNPTFPQDELNLKKMNAIESLKFNRSDAGFLADERFSKIVYGEHPYGVTSPTVSQVENITQTDLRNLHAEKFIPNNATFLVVGDVKKDELIAEISAIFGNWKKGSVDSRGTAEVPKRTKVSLTVVDRADSAQSNIIIGNPAINRTHEDYFACLVMNQILGSGATSRLFMNIREDKGYTYGAYSSFDARRLTGTFEASAEVRNEVTGAAMTEFFYELNRIRDVDVSEDDISLAKSFLTGVFPLKVETIEGLMGQLVSQELFNLPKDYLDTYREKIDAISVSDVRRVAKKYIDVDKIAIIVVGNLAEISSQLTQFADDMEVFDVEGNLKT
jgi:zinc protease